MASTLVATPSPMASPMSVATSMKNKHHTVVLKKKYDPKDAPLIESTVGSEKVAQYATAQFDPEVHLTFKPNSAGKKIYVDDLGIDSDEAISPVGAVYPFDLFSQEAIDIMRWEISRPEVLSKYAIASSHAKCQLRGYARDSCPFTYAAWTHPTTVEIVSQQAGIPLEVVFDYEIAHVNFASQDKSAGANGKSVPVLDWHYDSYPFVCVLMLSDTSNMSGGETILRNEFGDVFKVEDPQRGHATVLQGRYIEHLASTPQSGKERITMVTSYRPKSAFVKDDSVLTTVLPASDVNELLTDWTEYRMERLEEQLETVKKDVRAARKEGKPFDLAKVTELLSISEKYLRRTYKQMHGEHEFE